MTKITKIASSIAVFAFMVAIVAPSVADAATIRIRSNGADSENHVKVRVRDDRAVRQPNRTRVANDISVTQSTGDNTAYKNTDGEGGGTFDVDSGNATADVFVETTTDGNTGNVEDCGCVNDVEDTVVIKGNGADSDNSVRISRRSSHKVRQTNDASVRNNISVRQTTGGNTASKNTGGSVDVNSGDADVIITSTTTTGGNTLN